MQNGKASTTDTLSKIQSILAKEYHLPIERLGPDQALADLGIDSLTTIDQQRDEVVRLSAEFFRSCLADTAPSKATNNPATK